MTCKISLMKSFPGEKWWQYDENTLKLTVVMPAQLLHDAIKTPRLYSLHGWTTEYVGLGTLTQ